MRQRRDNLKNQMVEEQRLSHLNRMKILTQWRKWLRLSKTETLKKQIQIFQQNHDREVDAKDAILQMLDRDLDEAEEQYQMALRNHLIHIDDLIALQESRMRGLHEEFERDVRILKEEYDREKSDIARTHDAETQELHEMIETIREEEVAKLRQIRDNFLAEKEQTRNKNVEEAETMKMDLIKKIDSLDNAFEVEFQQYMHETEPRTQKYSEMLDANTKTTEAIYGMSVDINRTKKKTQKLALKAAQIKRENDDRNEALRREKDTIIRHYHDLKKKMAKLRSQKEEHLGTLVTNSLHCMEKLRSYQSLGERILKTAELCRKLETEKEKVLPFYQSDPDAQEESDQMVEKIQGVDPHSYNEFKQLDNFYKRYNKVNLDKLAI
mmetsp:Transcript_37838/g.46044  ORF Transcript_37838/g.46044 Transcript_37838/m.46044 type:complete len:381 (-) Transcript_37838:403-1545(-)